MAMFAVDGPKNLTPNTYTKIATIPSGLRPPVRLYDLGLDTNDGTRIALDVRTNGDVYVYIYSTTKTTANAAWNVSWILT